MDYDVVLAQVARLESEYADLAKKAKYDDLSDLEDDLSRFAVRLQAAMDRLAPRSSTYAKEADRYREYADHLKVRCLLGVLRALAEDVRLGWMSSVEELLHADTFSDFLEMASELNEKGYKDGAAVIAGSVLEAHIRQLCHRQAIDTELANGAPKKADVMNADLARAEVYSKNQQKQITAWLGIRNSAAHGKYEEYQASDVTSLILMIRSFIGHYPA